MVRHYVVGAGWLKNIRARCGKAAEVLTMKQYRPRVQGLTPQGKCVRCDTVGRAAILPDYYCPLDLAVGMPAHQ